MEKLWDINEEKPLEQNKESKAPKCGMCNKDMVKVQFADGTVGWTCKCFSGGSTKEQLNG